MRIELNVLYNGDEVGALVELEDGKVLISVDDDFITFDRDEFDKVTAILSND